MDYKEGVSLLDEAEDEDDGRASPINRAIVPQNSNQVGLLCWCCIHLYLIFSKKKNLCSRKSDVSFSFFSICLQAPTPDISFLQAIKLVPKSIWFIVVCEFCESKHLFPPLPLSSFSFSFICWYYAY